MSAEHSEDDGDNEVLEVDLDGDDSEQGIEEQVEPVEVEEKVEEVYLTKKEKAALEEKIRMVSKEARMLFKAAEAGDVEACKELIRCVPISERIDYVNECDENGQTAAFYCVFGKKTSQAYTKVKSSDITNGHVECIRLFMEFGADPDHQDDKKNTILHLACATDKRAIIKIMLRYHADVTIENWEYRVCAQQAPNEVIRSQLIGFINTQLEGYKEEIKEKKILIATREELSYFRSLYDVMDQTGLDLLRFQEVFPLLEAEDEEDSSEYVIPPIMDARQFFMSLDADHNGIVSFQEFLHAAITYLREAEKSSGKKKGKKEKKKKKK